MARQASADSAQGFPYRESFVTEEVQKFSRWLQQRERTGITFEANGARKCTFIPDNDITGYFDRYLNPQSDSDRWEVECLVTAATQKSPRKVHTYSVAHDSPKVFAILTRIGYPDFIHAFVGEDRLQDHALPFGPDKKEYFPFVEPGQKFFEQFAEEQWRFCVKKLDFSLERMTFDDHRILPIKEIEELERGEGVSAIVHKIVLHEDYDNLKRPRDRRKSDGPGVKLKDLHTYVIKSYHKEDGDRYFRSEVKTFQVLNEADKLVPNVVGFHKAFVQNDSLNIILQYANIGTLEDYFRTVRRPQRGREILSVWRKLSCLNNAVAGIHKYAPRGQGTSSEVLIFQGWHQDIKPDNILVVGDVHGDPYNVEFLLADLGLSHFTAVVKGQAGTTGEDMPGARTYVAPEKNLDETPLHNYLIESKQKLDVWALGAVYSEFTTWVVQGWDGLQDYREFRAREVGSTGLGPVFHDKVKLRVLDCVRRHHQDLVDESSKKDCITPMIWSKILDLVFTRLEVRITASQLEHYMDSLLEQAETQMNLLVLQHSNSDPANTNARSSGTQSPPHTPDQAPPKIEDANNGQYGKESPFITYSGESSTPRDSAWTQTSGSPMHSPDSQVFEGGSSIIETSPHSSPPKRPLSTGFGLYLSETSPLPTMLHPTGRTATGSPQNSSSSAAPHHDAGITVNGRIERMKPMEPANPLVQHKPLLPVGGQFQAKTSASTFPSADASISTKNEPSADANSHTQRPEPPPPKLTIEDLKNWAKHTRVSKNSIGSLSFGGSKNFPLTDDPRESTLLGKMRSRDHIFILDDAISMTPFWNQLKDLYADLILMVKKKELDPNGGQLLFITSNHTDERVNTRKLVEAVRRHEDQLKGPTDFARKIDSVLSHYIDRLRRDRNTSSISIYVLTNGVWETHQGTQSDRDHQLEAVADAIARAVKALDQLYASRTKIGIQFIRFGNDEIGEKRLEYLDKKLQNNHKLSRDICDTTPANGDVWKMLLGAIDSSWDDDP